MHAAPLHESIDRSIDQSSLAFDGRHSHSSISMHSSISIAFVDLDRRRRVSINAVEWHVARRCSFDTASPPRPCLHHTPANHYLPFSMTPSTPPTNH
jgi:hypothetical protein